MDNQGLRTLLEQLHKELEQINSIDEKGLELLSDLETDIHSLLARTGSDIPRPPLSSVQRIEESIDYFESTHPTLSATLIKLLAVLGNAGI
jgi:hypothetical protein